MDALTLLLIVGCLVVGAGAGWALANARGNARTATGQARLTADLAARDATIAALEGELARMGDAQRELSERVRADTAARDERERREQAVLRALEPVRESLQAMRTRVDSAERERHEQYGTLAEQLRRAQESDESLRATTESLAAALRSGSTRGVWGETQLRRVVEAAGLTRHVDFDLQASLTSEAGGGRPDMVIRLPGGKALALDAKAPLDAYLEATAIPVTADGDAGIRRRALMTRHVKAVRAHVDALAKKQYWTGLDASPEFVICFLPSESLLASALDEDPALLEYAFSQRVALASPVNLWAVLKTVAFTWSQQEVSDQARDLLRLGTELYTRLGSLSGHADDLRRALERTVDSYNRFVGSLESRVLVTARRFPGIDETKLDAVGAPAAIESTPRRFAAPELLDASDETVGPDLPVAAADLDALRHRLDV